MKWISDGSLHSSGYGTPELIQLYRRYMSWSLMMSILLQVVCIATYYVLRQPDAGSFPQRIAEIFPYQLLTPPSLSHRYNVSSTSFGARNVVSPKFGIPIPVPDPFVDSDSTIPTQRQLADASHGFGDMSNPGDGVIPPNVVEDDNTEPPPFRMFEKGPQAVKQIEPDYPEAALRTGIQGSVIVKLWVDKGGKVRKAVVLKSDAEILNSASIQAAMHWVFAPAIMNHGPVSVWITIPFRFKILDK